MRRQTKVTGVGLAMLMAAGLVACAPQQQATPSAAAAPAANATATAPTPVNHQEMMAHCAEMRQQAHSGAQVTADMQQMLTFCHHMDHTMGARRGRSGPSP